MRNQNASLVRLNKIKRLIDVDRFNPVDFLNVCPYSLEELSKKNKKQEIIRWRQVGIVWFCLAGKTNLKASNLFGRDPATGIHASQVVLNALEVKSYPDVIEIIEQLCKHVKHTKLKTVPLDDVVNFLSFYYEDKKIINEIAVKAHRILNI